MRRLSVIALLLLLLAAWWWLQHPGPPVPPAAATAEAPAVSSAPPTATARTQSLPSFLPPEAKATVALIQQGGPFAHPQDGGVFSNREGHLPRKSRGYYREYTVETPGLTHRGARRIVTGGQPAEVYFYSDDHYDSFRSFTVAQ